MKVWVLTSEYNDYDQHGEYFEAVFAAKPTLEQILSRCDVTEEEEAHILNGGGRVTDEDKWFNLTEHDAEGGKS